MPTKFQVNLQTIHVYHLHDFVHNLPHPKSVRIDSEQHSLAANLNAHIVQNIIERI